MFVWLKNIAVNKMLKSVELPIIEPIYGTYHYQGNGSAIISENPSIRNWYLNRVMNLSCTRHFLYGFTTPVVSVYESSAAENPYLEQIRFPLKILGTDVHRVIRDLIDNGYYVAYCGVDDYFVEGKSWYHERHFTHDGLISGYDQNAKTYTIYAYDHSWTYKTFKTSQRGFEYGRKASLADGYNGDICGLKAKPDKVEIDPNEILICLKGYLDSSLEKYPFYEDGMVYGTAVHDYIAMYMNMLFDQQISYNQTDSRVFRMLWEHKRAMAERIKAVESLLHINREISTQYDDIVSEADAIRMMYASHHMKCRFSILSAIRTRVIVLKRSEIAILTKFVDKLEAKLQ